MLPLYTRISSWIAWYISNTEKMYIIFSHLGRVKKRIEGEGEWDVREEMFGRLFNGARRCIELPSNKIEAIQ